MSDDLFSGLPTTAETLLARLDALDIPHRTVSHAPVFTVEEAKSLRGDLPGGHCKNLFLRDKKKRSYLFVMLEDRVVDIKALEQKTGAARLSFGSADRLMEFLGVIPGSVTPFSLIHDPQQAVTVYLDRTMLSYDPLNYHPLRNDMTTAVAPGDLLKFIAACGHTPNLIDLD